MNDEQKKKLKLAKKTLQGKPGDISVGLFDTKELVETQKHFSELLDAVNTRLNQDAEAKSEGNGQLVEANNLLVKLISRIEELSNFAEAQTKIKSIIVENFPEFPKLDEVTVKNQLQWPEWLNTKESIDNIVQHSRQTVEALRSLAESLKKGQRPEEFTPFRRVRKVGNRLEFDDSSWGGSAGGGGAASGGGTSTGGLTNAELRAAPIDVNASIDTSAVATSAIQTNGAQKTQIVDAGGEAATVTGGKLDVNASVDTTGLATSTIQTDKSQFTKLTDGTDTALITAAGEQNVLATAQPGVDIGDVTVNNTSLPVAGDVAAASADSGNPVKVGGKYNSSQPTLTDAQRGDLQLDSRGNVKVSMWQPNGATSMGNTDNADAVAVTSSGIKLGVSSRNTVFNGTTWDRMPGDTTGVKIQDGGNSITVDGTVTTTPPSNASTNVAQLAGTTTDTNSGTKSAGTLRVVLATDQPALTNKLLVTPDLPTGAATAAKQPALGTAGAASADVITVQGIASGTAQPISGTVTSNQGTAGSTEWLAGGGVASGATDAGNPVKVGGRYNTTKPTLTDGQRGDWQLGARGAGLIELYTNTANAPLSTVASNADAQATGSTNIRLETVSRNSVYNGSTWDRARGDTTGTDVHAVPKASGGWDTFNATSGDGSTALTATAQQVKATAGQVGGWYIYNPNATATYVNFYNVVSASVTVGTTNQQMVICVPPTAGANVEFTNGLAFTTAISISATTTGGGNTAPTTALEANIFYK